MTGATLQDWLAPVVAASEGVLDILGMGYSPFRILEEKRDRSEGSVGGLIALTSELGALHVGFFTQRAGSEYLASTMLELEASELEPDLVSDSLCELVNMVGGALKTEVEATQQGLRLGLPVYVHGTVWPSEDSHAFRLSVEVDGHPFTVLVFVKTN